MSFVIRILAVVAFCTAGWTQAQTAATKVPGTWEGESKCTVPDSPCRDEHAIYHIVADPQNPAKLKIDASKVVDGTPEPIGTLECRYQPDRSTLSCTGSTRSQDDWEFRIADDTMTGTLTIGEKKTLYRRITLRKVATKAP